jgi:D-alanine--poly(phosphoribitol) ligase subunit 1
MRFDTARKIFLEEAVEPDKLAFACVDRDLIWLELKNLSDSICERLQKAEISLGHPVLLYGNKEAFLLAGLISCYRAGLPFIPVNPELPGQRISKIVHQSGAQALIASDVYVNLPEVPVIFTETKSKGTATFEKRYPDIAYILFTSGSSGDPKGVLVSDKNLTSFVQWFTSNFPVGPDTIFINQAELSFDISLADIFGALQTGGSAILNSATEYANDQLFFERINKYHGNYWNSTPSFVMKYFGSKNFNHKNLPGLKNFVLSGENLSSNLVKELVLRFPNTSVTNAYGPTEATIFSSYVQVTPNLLAEDSIPIAKSGTETISLEQDEIVITGQQVSQGYLDNAQLTKEKFISHNEQPAFRTGDLVRLKNNFLYFAGRKDGQIKFNGYRIEPGEIKQVLEKIKGIEEAECLPLIIDNRVKRLIAFVRINQQLNPAEIKNQLAKELPVYMIPSEIILLEEFPRTVSFKTDRKKLLEDYLQK